MNFRSLIAAASTAVILVSGAASASTVTSIGANTVTGEFSAKFHVTAINVTNLSGAESAATMANFQAAQSRTLGLGGSTADPTFNEASFFYEGALKFGTSSGSSTTIGSFIGSGTGSSTLDMTSDFARLTNSSGNIGESTAITTFYLFKAMAHAWTAGAFDIAHDDGVLVVDVGGVAGPNSVRGTRVEGFAGGDLAFLYVSTNSDPSIFRVDSDVSAVPLPAAGWMLIAGLAALGAASRRRKAA